MRQSEFLCPHGATCYSEKKCFKGNKHISESNDYPEKQTHTKIKRYKVTWNREKILRIAEEGLSGEVIFKLTAE